MTGAGMLVGLMFGAGLVSLVPAVEVELSDRRLRLGDVVRGAGLDAALAERVIATLPPSRDSVTVERSAIAGLVRRAVPGLEVEGASEGTFTLRAPPTERAEALCLALAVPVAAGRVIVAGDAAPADCRAGGGEGGIVYDRAAAAPRAAADLSAGHYLGRIVLPAEAGLDSGDALTLAATAGPVRIERSVVALQPARPGGRLFVRTADGDVVAAEVAGESLE